MLLVREFSYSLICVTFCLGVPVTSSLPALAQTSNPPPLQRSTPPTTPVIDNPYLLGVGDQLQLTVFGVEQYSGERLVLPDGTINLQGLGPVKVSGLTIPQAQQLISQRYAAILRQPIVTLNLIAPRQIQIAIAGEVMRPGSYSLSGGGQNDAQFARLSQAIKIAGGITQSADLSLVQLRRNDPRQPVVSLNLSTLLQNGDLSQDPILRDGDSIFIPTATSFDPLETRQLISSSLMAPPSQSIQVVVVGEVRRPGAYSLAQEGGNNDSGGDANIPAATRMNLPTVTKAIQTAGGITNSADIRNIEVRRITQTGLQTTQVNLWELLQSGDINQDLFLQEGDTIIIPTASVIEPENLEDIASASFSPTTINVNLVGEVVQPGVVQIPPNTPLNQALLAAGGFDKLRARMTSVELIRLNPNGTVTRRNVPINFELGNASENNPVLQNNDVIVVRRSLIARVGDTSEQTFRPVRDFFTLFNFFRLFFQQ